MITERKCIARIYGNQICKDYDKDADLKIFVRSIEKSTGLDIKTEVHGDSVIMLFISGVVGKPDDKIKIGKVK